MRGTPASERGDRASPADVSSADAVLLRRARRRLLAAVWRKIGLVGLGVLAAAVAIWYSSTPVGPGLYLPLYSAAQLVITPESGSSSGAVPFLWVPGYPGQTPPDLRYLGIVFGDGTEGYWYAYDPYLRGGTVGFPRYRQGTFGVFYGASPPVWSRLGPSAATEGQPSAAPIWPTEGAPYVMREAKYVYVTRPGGSVLASAPGRNLYVVQVNVPVSTGSNYLAWGFGAGTYLIKNISPQPVELVEIVLPPPAYPLTEVTFREGPSAPGSEEAVPFTLPRSLAPGEGITIRLATSSTSSCYSVAPLIVFRVGGELQYWIPGSSFDYVNGSLGERYELESPDGP